MTLENDDYDGPILAGQRWRNRGVAGHQTNELLTVLRFNGRSVQIVYEGARHKGGKRYGIPLDTFRRNYNLVSQPPGYKEPEPEPDGPAEPQPKRAVSDYFRRRRWMQETLDAINGDDALAQIAGGPPVNPDPPREDSPMDEPPTESADEREPVVVRVAVAAQTVHLIPRDEYPAGPASADAPEPEAEAVPAPEPERDPLEAFLDHGRDVVAGYDLRLAELEERRTKVAEALARLDGEIDEIAQKRARADLGIQAAIAAVLGLDHPAKPVVQSPPVVKLKDPKRVLGTVASANGTTRLRGATGYVPQPGKISQKVWVLGRLPAPGGEFTIQGVVDAFAEEYGITREQAIKNVSSLLGYQARDPNPEWPAIERVQLGVYRVVERQPTEATP